MPFHPRYILLGALGMLGSACLAFCVATGVPLMPAIAAGVVSGAGYPFFLRHALVPATGRAVGLRSAWLFVVTAGFGGSLLWLGAALNPWESPVGDAIVFLVLCLACGLLAVKTCVWSAKTFRRIDFEMSLPAAER